MIEEFIKKDEIDEEQFGIIIQDINQLPID